MVGMRDNGADLCPGCVFQVSIFLDGVLAWSSPIIYQSAYPVNLNVTGVHLMTWWIDPINDFDFHKEVNWGYPVLTDPMCFGLWADDNSSLVCSGQVS